MNAVRERVRPAPQQWPNGSAVFEAGKTHTGLNGTAQYERCNGFIGRICRIPGGKFKVWAYENGVYIHKGIVFAYTDGLALLGGSTPPNKETKSRYSPQKPIKEDEILINAVVTPLLRTRKTK